MKQVYSAHVKRFVYDTQQGVDRTLLLLLLHYYYNYLYYYTVLYLATYNIYSQSLIHLCYCPTMSARMTIDRHCLPPMLTPSM